MRSLIAIFALLLSMLGSTAQTTQPRHGSTAGDEYAAQIVSIISQMPHAKLIATESEQGIDELDSLYCLNTKTYEFPYKRKDEQQAVGALINEIIKAYDADLPHHTGGFCSMLQLESNPMGESQQVSMYFSATRSPILWGGKGISYVILRQNLPNPAYRYVNGMAWWLAYNQKGAPVVRFRTIHLQGPFSKDHYANALNRHRSGKSCEPTTGAEDSAQRMKEAAPAEQLVAKASLLSGIQIFTQLYTQSETVDEISRAIVGAINERVVMYLKEAKTVADYQQLFHILKDIPRYKAIIYYGNSEATRYVDFEWLEKNYADLDIFCISWVTQDDPACTFPEYDPEREDTVAVPANFLLQVYLND